VEVIRGVAAAVGVLVVLATMLLAQRLAGRIAAVLAGLLAATVGASPFVESFTLSGELIASLWVVLSLLAFAEYVRMRRPVWVLLAGLLAGAAVMTKQSAIDSGLAAALYLLWRERGRALRPLALLLAGAAVPVGLGAATAPRLGDWWFAFAGYRARGDSLFTGSFEHRLHLLADSLPTAGKALGLLVLLAAVGWVAAPLLARLWLVAAVVGFLGGGNFHPHYYLQLVPPLALLAGIGTQWLLGLRPRLVALASAAAVTASVAVAAPLWFAGPQRQAREIWPHDPHLLHDAAVVDYVKAHTKRGEKIFVVWAAADVYYLADRDPAFKYMWFRNIQTITHALRDARRMLAARRPTLVVVAQPPGSLDRSGRTAKLLRRDYRLAARVDGVPIYRR
jgi:4-amino-4-deoxy-L-arabinose transferase-like glycosyltransferase